MSSGMFVAFPKAVPTITHLTQDTQRDFLSSPIVPPPGGAPDSQAVGSGPREPLSPDVLSGCLAVLLDGRALIFVVQPGISLAGSVTVVGELALAAAMELLLPFEAGVADYMCQAGKTESRLMPQ